MWDYILMKLSDSGELLTILLVGLFDFWKLYHRNKIQAATALSSKMLQMIDYANWEKKFTRVLAKNPKTIFKILLETGLIFVWKATSLVVYLGLYDCCLNLMTKLCKQEDVFLTDLLMRSYGFSH